MLRMIGWVGLVAAVLVTVVSLGAPQAVWASPIGNGGVDCDQFPSHPDCTVTAAVFKPVVTAGPGGDPVCRLGGEQVPCVTDQGWLGSDGCRWLRQGSESPPADADGPGAWYQRTCSGDSAQAQERVWLPESESPEAALAAVAVSRLVLPRPQIVLSPPMDGPQLVMLPTWLWVSPQWWVSRSATASVPGLTITAVATPTRVRWVTGDGAEHICDAGTAYEADVDPVAASPDCGHVYTRSGTYILSATVTWQVSWSGGDLSGTVDPLFSTASTAVEVVESRSVNTARQQ